MDILFKTNKVEKQINDFNKLFKLVKDKNVAESLLSKIRTFEMSENLYDFHINEPHCRMHPLWWDRSKKNKKIKKTEIAIDAHNKTCPYRIVFITNDWDDITEDWANKEKLKSVTSITIKEISKHYK